MPLQYPCPNPVCTHQFSAQEVQATGSVQCPQCGQAFQFRSGPGVPNQAGPNQGAQARQPPHPATPPAAGKQATAAPGPGKAGIVKPSWLIPPQPAAGAPGEAPPPMPAAAPARTPAAPRPTSAEDAPTLAPGTRMPPEFLDEMLKLGARKPASSRPAGPPSPEANAADLTADAPSLPVAKVVAPPPSQTAGAPAVMEEMPLEEGYMAPPPPATFGAVEDLMPKVVRPRGIRKKKKKKQSYLPLALGVGGGLLALGIAIFVIVKFSSSRDAGRGAQTRTTQILGKIRNLRNAEELAFKLVLEEGAWEQDHELRQKMTATGLWKATDKNKPVWFAVAARDYGLARPREAELLQEGIVRLESYFQDTLELEEKAEPVELVGQTGQRLLFKGQINAVVWWGHMYMVAHHGFGYWLYVAAPTKEEADEALAQLQQAGNGFQLTTRTGWREQPPSMESFTSGSGALTLSVPEGVFKPHNAKDQDERGELYLFALYQKEKDNRKNASVLVLGLDKAGDLKEAMKSAKGYLEEKKKEEGKEYRLAPVKDGAADLGSSEAVGNRPGRIAEYRLLFGEQAQRYWLVAVVNDAGMAYIIRCDCTWESRQIWREDFLQLLKRAKFQKAND